MKKLQNPTTFFFRQAENVTTQINSEIQKFVAKLINKDVCQLCKKPYNTQINLPRILIHCGHTFCSPCLIKFFMQPIFLFRNRRVRCPMCLKLVKYIDTIERLPINHTIYYHLAEKQNQMHLQNGNGDKANLIDANKFLFGQFERVQKQAHMMQNPQKIDPESGLPFCVFHGDRVEHFYCEAHKTSGCRVCIEIGHSKPECKVIDLYNVENPQQYLNPLEERIQEPDISEPFISMNGANKNNMLGLNDYDDGELINDDSNDEEEEMEGEQSSSSLDRKSI